MKLTSDDLKAALVLVAMALLLTLLVVNALTYEAPGEAVPVVCIRQVCSFHEQVQR